MDNGSGYRYTRRIPIWVGTAKLFPRLRHHGWWLLHNVVSHPILGVWVSQHTVWFHDWTSMHLNCRSTIRPSPQPQVNSRWHWLFHNVVGHVVIGLLPVPTSFRFHDKTAEAMHETYWV